MTIQKVYECNKCGTEINKSENPKFTKAVVDACPVCGSKNISLKKTLVIGKKPNS
jgi:DNA-directed RNA polymerase subunit RPC12/RpoP